MDYHNLANDVGRSFIGGCNTVKKHFQSFLRELHVSDSVSYPYTVYNPTDIPVDFYTARNLL